MNSTAPANLRTLLPHLNESEIAAAYERLQRYVRCAVDVLEDKVPTRPELTTPIRGGSVNAGQVDPSTFTNTG